jgi:uncharacterized protein YlbG (UPF0298 family)
MEYNKLTKQLIDFQRVLFNNTNNTFSVMQDNSENMVTGFWDQFTWVSKDTKKPFNDSFKFVKKAREDYRKAIDQGFDKLAELVDDKADKTARKG